MVSRIDEGLGAMLRGVPPREALADAEPAAVLDRAEYHGLVPLVAERLGGGDGPPPWREPVRARARAMLAADLLREMELRQALAVLHDAHIGALVIKGAHLAYTCYPRPDLRPRLDSDLLVPADARATVDAILLGLGYEKPGHTTGALLSYQTPYEKRREGVRVHVFDVHWRIANPQAFAGLLPYDDLARDAVPIPGLGAGANGIAPLHALLLACTHRVAHHFDSNRLIWLYDIHLLASGLGGDDWARFVELAERFRVRAVCRRSLDRARACLGTPFPDELGHGIQAFAATDAEPTARYIGRPRRHVHNIVTDLQALPSWADRARLMRQHLFPPPEYMRNVYAKSSRAPLVVLYARRVVRGARRWLARPADDSFITG